MENIPEEVRAYQEQFWAEEAKKVAREANKKVNPKKAARLDALLRKPKNGGEFAKVAKKRFGMVVKTGGREGTYLEADNGSRCPLTTHPKDLAKGTACAVRKFMERGGMAPVVAVAS